MRWLNNFHGALPEVEAREPDRSQIGTPPGFLCCAAGHRMFLLTKIVMAGDTDWARHIIAGGQRPPPSGSLWPACDRCGAPLMLPVFDLSAPPRPLEPVEAGGEAPPVYVGPVVRADAGVPTEAWPEPEIGSN